MKVLAIRFCCVSDEAPAMAEFFDAMGLEQKKMDGSCEGFSGAIFPAGESWVEIWQSGPQMPAGIMLQIVVDDADAYAEHARSKGLEPNGPMDAHGERIYFAKAPSGLQISFQSKLP